MINELTESSRDQVHIWQLIRRSQPEAENLRFKTSKTCDKLGVLIEHDRHHGQDSISKISDLRQRPHRSYVSRSKITLARMTSPAVSARERSVEYAPGSNTFTGALSEAVDGALQGSWDMGVWHIQGREGYQGYHGLVV